MRKVFVAVVVLATLIVGAPAVAGNAEFPPLTFDINSAEGVDVDPARNVYVSAPTAEGVEIWKFNPHGEGSVLASFPDYYAAAGVTVRGGYLYAAVGASVDDGYGAVFRIHRQTGDSAMVDGTDQIYYPNDIAFDGRGNMYITETYSLRGDLICNDLGEGGLWIVPKGGSAELLPIDSSWLSGNCWAGVGFPVGANGITYSHGSLFIAVSEWFRILEIPVDQRGNLGGPSVFAQLPFPSATDPGAAPDGIEADRYGNIYAAIITNATVIRIDRNDPAGFDVLGDDGNGLVFPASVAVQQQAGHPAAVYVTNLEFVPLPFDLAGLVKIDL